MEYLPTIKPNDRHVLESRGQFEHRDLYIRNRCLQINQNRPKSEMTPRSLIDGFLTEVSVYCTDLQVFLYRSVEFHSKSDRGVFVQVQSGSDRGVDGTEGDSEGGGPP